MTTRRFTSSSEEETREIGREIGRLLGSDGVALLSGDLGAGKTVLTRGIAQALGIDPEEVQSPTFTLLREHEGPGGRLFHLDLYRLDPDQVWGVGVEETFARAGVKVVEWAERLPFDLPGALRLTLTRRPAGGREIVLETQALHAEETL